MNILCWGGCVCGVRGAGFAQLKKMGIYAFPSDGLRRHVSSTLTTSGVPRDHKPKRLLRKAHTTTNTQVTKDPFSNWINTHLWLATTWQSSQRDTAQKSESWGCPGLIQNSFHPTVSGKPCTGAPKLRNSAIGLRKWVSWERPILNRVHFLGSLVSLERERP